MIQVYQCAGESWSPIIGDPTALGWITTVAYFFAALLAGLALIATPNSVATVRSTYMQFWWLMLISFIALGFNKQLDLQSLFTAIARCWAIRDGWYADHRRYQMLFIVGAVVGGGLLSMSGLFYFRKILGLVRMAAIGFVLVVTFVVIRAVSFHHVDQIIGDQILGMRVNALLELPGIALVGLNATWLVFAASRLNRF